MQDRSRHNKYLPRSPTAVPARMAPAPPVRLQPRRPRRELYGVAIRMYGISEQMNTLSQVVCSRVRAGIFCVLFGLQRKETHLREIARLTGFALGTVQQDLQKLTKLGLVCRRRDGNRIYYAANENHPLCADIRQLTLKTAGLAGMLGAALRSKDIRCAFVFGSLADGTAGAESDIDLMVVGDIGLRKVATLLSGAGPRLGREINPHVLSPAEFARRRREREHFVTTVDAAPKIFLVGSEHDLETMS